MKKLVCLLMVLIMLMSTLTIAIADEGHLEDEDHLDDIILTTQDTDDLDNDLEENLDLDDFDEEASEELEDLTEEIEDELGEVEEDIEFDTSRSGFFGRALGWFSKNANARHKKGVAAASLKRLHQLAQSEGVSLDDLETARERYHQEYLNFRTVAEDLGDVSAKEVLKHNLRSRAVLDRVEERADEAPEELRNKIKKGLKFLKSRVDESEDNFDGSEDEEVKTLRINNLRRGIKSAAVHVRIASERLDRLESKGVDVSDLRERLYDISSSLESLVADIKEGDVEIDQVKEIKEELKILREFIGDLKDNSKDLLDSESIDEDKVKELKRIVKSQHESQLRNKLEKLDKLEDSEDAMKAKARLKNILETSEKGEGLKDVVKERVKDRRAHFKERVNDRKAKLKDNAMDKLQDRKDNAKDKLQDRKDDAMDKLQDRKDDAMDKLQDRKDDAKAKLQDRKDDAKAKATDKKSDDMSEDLE
jgi:hypothetical protein